MGSINNKGYIRSNVNQYPTPDIDTSLTFQSIQGNTIDQLSVTLKADIGSVVTINFGDGRGNLSVLSDGHDNTYVSIYSQNNTSYNVVLSGHLFGLTKFAIESEPTVSLYIDDFKTNNVGLKTLDLKGMTGSITGSVDNLPPSLIYLRLDSVGNLLTGSIDNLSKSLYFSYLISHPLIIGSLNNLSQYLAILSVVDCPSIGGNINGFGEDMRVIYLKNLAETITGTLESLPNKRMKTLVLQNLGTGISGNINSLLNTEKIYYGGLSYIVISPTNSTNSFTGSLTTFNTNQSMLPDAEVYPSSAYWAAIYRLEFVNLGENVTGQLDSIRPILPLNKSIPYMTYLIPDIAAESGIIIKNSGTMTYEGGALPIFGSVPVTIWCGLGTAQLDAFIIEFASKSTTAINYDKFDLSGNNEGHSVASNSAITKMGGEYRNVFLNDEVGTINFDINLGFTATALTNSIILNFNRRFKKVGIDWGDGVIDYVSTTLNQEISHTYATTGVKNVVIKNALGLQYLLFKNMPTVTGNLNNFEGCDYIEYFRIASGNMTGELASVASNVTQTIYCNGNIGASATANIDLIGSKAQNLKSLYLAFLTAGITTGNISSLPTGLTSMTLYDLGSGINITTGAMPAWSGLTATLHCNHSSEDVDGFLNAWALTAGVGTKTINIQRMRTSASDAAVITLNSKGKTINTAN